MLILNSKALNMEWGEFSYQRGNLLDSMLYGMAINAAIFYGHVYRLIPHFLLKKQYFHYARVAAGWIVGLSLLESLLDFGYLYFLYGETDTFSKMLEDPQQLLREFGILTLSMHIVVHSFFSAAAILYRLPWDYIRHERHKQQLTEARLHAELKFLKAQINPHFLFNGINSIYHLIGQDDAQARQVLLQFSDLLRYQLYEGNADFIPLEKELQYLQNYISIERVRKEQDAVIEVVWPDKIPPADLAEYKIAPLILSPFLENAFKFLSLHSARNSNHLSIVLRIDEAGQLYFSVSNTLFPLLPEKASQRGGIGLENVQRRLQLLYQTHYQLQIEPGPSVFSITLKLPLHVHTLSHRG